MSQDNIFREVDEELRSDRMRAFWRRFAPLIIGAAVAVVLLVAFNEGWSWYHSNNAAQSSDELYAAFGDIDGGDLAAAQTKLDQLIADGTGGYPTLARFRKAGVLAHQGDAAGAAALYDSLATDLDNPRLRELALVLAGTVMVDAGSLADVAGRVETIAAEGNPLRNAAREAMGLAQYKAGDFAAAQTSFQAVLDDPQTQDTTRQRMSYYLGLMVADGAITPAAPDTAATTAADEIDTLLSGDTPANAAAPADDVVPADAAAPPADDVVPANTAAPATP